LNLSPSQRRVWLCTFVALAGLAAWMDVASQTDVQNCESLIRSEIPNSEAYFRAGYRFSVSRYTPGERVLYVSFTKPSHGLATCRLEQRGQQYEIVSYSIDWGIDGETPRSIP
jgi:hypothetical protein